MEQPEVYEKLVQYIASLSAEEREKHRDLIEDTLKRDRELARNFREGRKNAEKFAENLTRVLYEAIDLHSSISMLNERLSELRDISKAVPRPLIGEGPCMN